MKQILGALAVIGLMYAAMIAVPARHSTEQSIADSHRLRVEQERRKEANRRRVASIIQKEMAVASIAIANLDIDTLTRVRSRMYQLRDHAPASTRWQFDQPISKLNESIGWNPY